MPKMRKIELPELRFSNWYRWENRKTIPGKQHPGVYMIAIINKEIEGNKPEFIDVSYIGMTNSKQGLKGRWQQFFDSIRGKGSHSGGNKVYADLGHYDTWREKLFVCAMPIDCNTNEPSASDLIRMGWVTYLKYEALGEFSKSLPRMKNPKYNLE